MHPSQASWFDWDEANEEHLAKHDVSPFEVEQVFLNGPIWAPNRKNRAGKWKMVGWTDGGRALTIIVHVDIHAGSLRAITAWPAAQTDMTRYLNRRRSRS